MAFSHLNTTVIDKHLFDLQTIANIPKGKRISTSDEFINIEEESAFQPVFRTLKGESRRKAVGCVIDVIDDVVEYADILMESRYLDKYDHFVVDAIDDRSSFNDGRNIRILYLKKIKNSLSEANEGIDNLCETYSNDANVIAKLMPVIANINNQVSKLVKILIDLNENSDGKFLSRKYQVKDD